MDYTLLGQLIQEARQQLGLTQEDAAELMGMTQSYIAQIEQGRHTLTLETALLFSEKLRIPFDKLWFLTGNNPRADVTLDTPEVISVEAIEHLLENEQEKRPKPLHFCDTFSDIEADEDDVVTRQETAITPDEAEEVRLRWLFGRK